MQVSLGLVVLTTVIASVMAGSSDQIVPRQASTTPTVAPTPSCMNNSSLPTDAPAQTLQLSLLNNLSVNVSLSVYVTGLDDEGQLIMLSTTGNWVYPQAQSQLMATPVSDDLCISLAGPPSQASLRLPGPLVAGRVWIARGALPMSVILTSGGKTVLVEPSPVQLAVGGHDTVWSFVELTYDPSVGLWANLSYVDFVGLLLRLAATDRNNQTQHAHGLAAGATTKICEALTTQSCVDGQMWAALCSYDQDQQALRILSPNSLISGNSSAFETYWDSYVDSVWRKYAAEPLLIDTQGTAGMVSCFVQEDELQCEGDSGKPLERPTSADIFGCSSGPFALDTADTPTRLAIVARLYAAFNRSTLLQDGGNIQPGFNSSSFYADMPTNFYSKLLHEYEVQKVGYAFPFDDVAPSQDVNQANELSLPDAQTLVILVEDS